MIRRTTGLALLLALAASGVEGQEGRRWIAGDHHVHSRFSVGWDGEGVFDSLPPRPIVGGDAIYPIPMNALMAKLHGLGWMVSTDHGGPEHSKVNRDIAYPELLLSRRAVPEVIQFYAMEFDTPGADHSSIILPHTHDEADRLYDLESRFSKRDAWPTDPERDQEARMLDALRVMDSLPDKPVVIAHHPSRSAWDTLGYRLYAPEELRNWNDLAPQVAVGMEGAPGHQAAALNPDATLDPRGARGGYGRNPTWGGFDPMTARLGGFWDSMLGEGRRWWITANSDSHVHWTEGGSDFWPGEYSKTYVWAAPEHDDILDGIRNGRVFVTLGDLISEMEFRVSSGGATATLGEVLEVERGADVRVEIWVRDPAAANAHGDRPRVSRVDLIGGEVHGPVADRTVDENPSTSVHQRWTESEWTEEGEWRFMWIVLEDVTHDGYLRVRGTNTGELEPSPDPRGEDPWTDLWFYSNPVFLRVR